MGSVQVPGAVVWAKCGRYPYWPAVVVHEREIAFIQGSVPQQRPGYVLVRFLNDGDYASVPATLIKVFTYDKLKRTIRSLSMQGAIDSAILWIERYARGGSSEGSLQLPTHIDPSNYPYQG